MEVKQCTRCKEEKPATEEFFGRAKRRNGTYGLRGMCRPCMKNWADSRYSKEYKAKKSAAWRARNPGHARNVKNRWRKENPDKRRATEKKYRETHPEKYSKKQSDSRNRRKLRNPELHRMKCTENSRRARLRNPLSLRLYQAKRREKIKSGEKVTSSQILSLFSQQESKCWWCGISILDYYEIDHVIPLSKGGEHKISNLKLSCKQCNLCKSAKTPYEFAGRLF